MQKLRGVISCPTSFDEQKYIQTRQANHAGYDTSIDTKSPWIAKQRVTWGKPHRPDHARRNHPARESRVISRFFLKQRSINAKFAVFSLSLPLERKIISLYISCVRYVLLAWWLQVMLRVIPFGHRTTPAI